MQKLVKLEVFLGKDCSHKYKGRLLGLITPDEYAKLVETNKYHRKLFSVGTSYIKDIQNIGDEIDDMRIVIAIKEADGEEIIKRQLFISEPLDMVSEVKETTMNFCGKRSYYIMEEAAE